MTARLYGLLVASSLLALSPSSLAQPTTASFDSNGVQIQYAERGSGEPVVLIHGFTGSYARHIENPGLMDRLEKAGYRAIAIDCRGHGQSGKPHDDSAYGMEMVRDVIRLMDHLKIERAHLFGYSMGGGIVSQLLVRQPERVLTATLLGAGWEGEDLTAFRSQMQALADGFARRDASPLIRAVTSGQKPPTDAEVAALNESLFARNDHQALAAAARGMTALFDVPRGKLQATTIPVLGIVGEQDAPNLTAVKRMATVVPKMEVVVLPGANHATSVRPSADPLIAFLAKHRTS
jgi:pimeloyl-ACP methyl ester carboxylesterase